MQRLLPNRLTTCLTNLQRNLQRHRASAWGALSAGLAMALLAGGCATTEPVVVAAETVSRKAAPQIELGDQLDQARQARQAGQVEKSRQMYREAAQAYPVSKDPWLHLAEDYFREGDYGNAILAAQEVLQRDGKNAIAHSVLAVSGLRVSAQSLAELRESTRFELGSRDEAVELTQQLRTHLGETVLIPQKSDAAPEPARPVPSTAVRARAQGGASRAPAQASTAAGAGPRPAARVAVPAAAGGATATVAASSPPAPAPTAAARPVTTRPAAPAGTARASAGPLPATTATAAPVPTAVPAGNGGRSNPFKVLD